VGGGPGCVRAKKDTNEKGRQSFRWKKGTKKNRGEGRTLGKGKNGGGKKSGR